jgi:hypothetical protein
MKPLIPFQHSYWAEPGKLLAGCCPGTGESAMIEEQLSGLFDAGGTLIVNLMETSEAALYHRLFDSYESILPNLCLARGRTIRVEHFPIPDRSVPTAKRMKAILQSIREELGAGGVVYVHCLGGIGRTGTVIGCHLAEQGHPNPLEQLQILTDADREYFWPTPQTEEQRNFVLKWLSKPGIQRDKRPQPAPPAKIHL